jgi:hypothetical protein
MWVYSIWAAKLDAKIGGNPMNVEPVVKFSFHQVDHVTTVKQKGNASLV